MANTQGITGVTYLAENGQPARAPATTLSSRPRWWASAVLTLALVTGSATAVMTYLSSRLPATVEQTLLKQAPLALNNSCTSNSDSLTCASDGVWVPIAFLATGTDNGTVPSLPVCDSTSSPTDTETEQKRLDIEKLLNVKKPEEKSVSALLPLQEFRTPSNAGWFYTLNQSEAASAATQYGFTRQDSAVGRLHPHAQPCTAPLYRLRTTTGSSYLVTGSTAERDSLVTSGQFINEGVLGYIDTAQQSGAVHLMRFSNHGQWRLAPESQTADQQAAGYTLDGPVGWVLP